MRTILLSFPLLLPALLAQEPSLRTDAGPPLTQAPGFDTATVRQATTARDHLARHPQQEVIFDRPRAGEDLWALGTAWKGNFDSRGFTVIPYFGTNAPRNFPLRVELASATVGGEPLALTNGEPVQAGAQVRTSRGTLTEVIDTKLDSLEQSFVFDRLPSRGAIAVDVRLSGEFTPSVIDGGLRFANEFGHIDYTKAIAVDAAGRRLPLDIAWTGETARMEIPASFVEQAQLPLVLDPVLNYWFLLASGVTPLQHDSDVATIQASSLGGRTLLVWQRQWSATDQDVWGLMFDGVLGLVQTDFNIDFTNQDWLKIAIAGHNYSQTFLLVSEVRIGLSHFIAGRTIAPDASLGAVFDIEREGFVGTAGDNFHPDVGADPYFGVGRFTVVFNKRALGTSDIYMRQITSSGGLVTTNAIALDTTHQDSKPSISKSCGQSNGQPAHWLVTWQRTWPNPPFDQEVRGRFVNWNGALPNGVFVIATTLDEETAPSPASPIDVDGQRLWPVVYEIAPTPGQPRDIVMRVYRSDMTFVNGTTISNNVPGSDDRDPEIDSDGIRTVAIYTVGPLGGQQGIEAVTVAVLPSSLAFRIDERSGLVTSGVENYGQGNVVADFSGGQAVTSKYFLAFSEMTSNTFRLEVFAGHAGNAGPFFTTRPTQCGTLSISATGSSAIGQTMTFTVGNAPLSGTIIGLPGAVPLNAIGCACLQGVDLSGQYLGNPLSVTIPANTNLVGVALSVQGWTIVGSQCLGFVDLSDTIDFTIR